ncbi:MAG: caspase family protein [Bacteroidota bacterium]|nr:caspase family protein [Bacteroidota bacterium]
MKKSIAFLITLACTLSGAVFGQVKNPMIVFDTGSATYSSAGETSFSADGKYLAIADVLGNINPSIKIIDVASGLPIRVIRGENNYWNVQFSDNFSYFRYNRLATSDADTNKFEAVQKTFTGEQVFKRKVENPQSGPLATFFGDQPLVEYSDHSILKTAGADLAIPSGDLAAVNGQLFIKPSWGSKVLQLFDPQTKTFRRLSFSKEGEAYSLTSYGFLVKGKYVIAVLESATTDSQLLKVFDLDKDQVVFSVGKLKIPYSEAIFSAALQFDEHSGTLTYPVKEGLAVADIFSKQQLVIPFTKKGTETINCSIDGITGNIITWCRYFLKVFNPQTGKASYDSDEEPTKAGVPGTLKFTDVKQNSKFPYLYVRRYTSNLTPDSTSIFDLHAGKFLARQMCNVITMAGNGKYIYGSRNFRYCLMNENLEVLKFINDCSLVTTSISEQAAPGNKTLLKTGVDYLCSFSRQQDGPGDEKVFLWDLKKLAKSSLGDDGAQEALDARHTTRNNYDISLLPLSPDYLSGRPPMGDTLSLTAIRSGIQTNIFFPKGSIKAVDIDTVKKLVFTVAAMDFKDDFLFIHDLSGKLISRYPLALKKFLTLNYTRIMVTDLNRIAVFQLPGNRENELTLSAYSLLNGKVLSDDQVTDGHYHLTEAGDLFIVHTDPKTDTLFTRSLRTGAQTFRRLRFSSFTGDLMAYFEPEEDWYKDSFLFYPKHGKVIVQDVTKKTLRCELPVTDDAIHSAMVSGDQKWLAYPDRQGTISLIDLQSRTIVAKFTGHKDQVRQLYFTQDQRYLVSSSDDGTLRFWDINEKKEKLKVVNFGADGYIMLSPEGYYRSSRSAIKRFGYVSGDHVLDAGQLDVRYNRPDMVLRETGSRDTALINAYYHAYEKRLKKLRVDTSAFKPGYSIPEADFINRDVIAYEQTQQSLKLTVSAKDSAYALSKFNLWVNNAPVYGGGGLSLSGSRHALDTTVTVLLSDNDNIIETSVINVNGIESARLPLYVRYTPAKAGTSKLYFIGIGIDKFADNSHNLQWSSKDIRDLAKAFGRKYGKNCEIDTLFDQNVTLKQVSALKARLRLSGINDKVIIAYSGHGLFSSAYDYYLSSYDVDFNQPAHNGIPYEDLENLLEGIPARRKLMLVDACHSGEVDKEDMKAYQANLQSAGYNGTGMGRLWQKPKGKPVLGTSGSFELMQQLFSDVGKNSGATVISAASGTQFAQEKGSLENGVFTYSIMEYLGSQRHCTVSALKAYVNKRVPELTKGMQVPTTRIENNAVDWQVW